MPHKKQQSPGTPVERIDEPRRNGATTQPAIKLLYTMKEAQLLLGGLSDDTIYKLLRQGELNSLKVGSRRLITRTSIDAFIEREVERERKRQTGVDLRD